MWGNEFFQLTYLSNISNRWKGKSPFSEDALKKTRSEKRTVINTLRILSAFGLSKARKIQFLMWSDFL
jgi:hypothetical protein